MNFNKKSIKDIDVSGKKVLVRCDYNVPMDDNGNITSDSRITATIPTLNYLLERNAAVILCSHLGRPKGEVNMKYSLKPVAKRLSEIIKKEVLFADDAIGENTAKLAADLKPGQILLLENLRFYKEEEKNDAAFAEKLASYADIYVSDAFGTVHRAHASTYSVAKFLPAVCGLLVEKELEHMGAAMVEPKRPFVLVTGGKKIADKIPVITNMLDKVDTIIIGGGMAYTFIKALGGNIGKSVFDAERLEIAKEILEKAKKNNVEIKLPIDTKAAKEFGADSPYTVVDTMNIPDELEGMDIGPETEKEFAKVIAEAGTVVWNGPMGVFEFASFAHGTNAIAEAMANSSAVTIIGGGDSAAAVEQMGYGDKMTHISTGGGASLELLAGENLPGIECLLDK